MQDNGFDLLITVPEYKKNQETVFYRVNFQDLRAQYSFENNYRYSELKQFHQTLETLKAGLPKFPGTHWWKSVNSDPTLIEQRREQLDEYFRNVMCSRQVRDSLIFKNFLLVAQKESEKRVEKEQKEKAKKFEGHSNNKKTKSMKFATPAPNPVNLPPTPGDIKERSQSVEHKPVKNKGGNRKTPKQQSPILNFGGSKIFRGILSNAAKQ